MIGWIDEDGVRVVTGTDANRLPLYSSVLPYRDAEGTRIHEPLGAHLYTELGWAGPEHLGTMLDPDIVYRVLWPEGFRSVAEAPAVTKAVFDRATGTASCEHGSAVERRAVYPTIGA